MVKLGNHDIIYIWLWLVLKLYTSVKQGSTSKNENKLRKNVNLVTKNI